MQRTGSRRWLTLGFALVLAMTLLAIAPTPAQPSSHTPIYDIQGEGHISPLVGNDVVTSGVVTAVGFRTLWVQDPDGDGNDHTSDGVQVSWTSSLDDPWSGFSVGDCIEFTGTVSEFIGGGASTGNLSTTNFFRPESVEPIDCGENFENDGLPEPVVIGLGGRVPPAVVTISDSELPVNLQDVPGVFNPDVDGIDFYESMEGMLVTVEDAQAVSATRRFSTFSAEFFTVPNRGDKRVVEPNSAMTHRGGIAIQADADGYGDLNPERVQVQLSGSPLYPGDMNLQVKVGDLVGDVTGPLGYSFGNFEIHATHVIDVVDGGTSPETTEISNKANWLNVASYNVLNLSVAGSRDQAQSDKLGEQIVRALKSPDVVALQEIQDDSAEADDGTVTADATLQMLVDSIVDAGGPTYEAFDVNPVDGTQGGVPGGNIRNAFLYDPNRVELLGYTALSSELLDTAGANPDAFEGTRIPLVGVFEKDGSRFTVISVHNSSRFGSTPIFGGPQPFVQAGEAEREQQSLALNQYVDFLLESDPNAQIIVTGDFNTFEFTDELTEDLPGPEPVLTNLVPQPKRGNGVKNGVEDYYTFIFDGNSQVLDHMFVTDSMRSGAKFDVVNVNVDFPRTFSNTTASDHEPLLGQFKLAVAPKTDYTLSVLHNNDGESQLVDAGSGLEDFGGVARFATVVDNAKEDADECRRARDCGSVMVSSGDNFLAGPEFNASIADGVWYDAMALDMLGYDAIQLGNHDFDFGPDTLAAFISEGFSDPGTPPYIGANLDFTGEPALQALADDGAIVARTVVEEDGRSFGIVGVVTPNLPFISSPGNTVVDPNLTDVVQDQVDALESSGVDRIIFISHLQGVSEDIALAATLEGVDVMVAGGGDEVLAGPDDLLVPGDDPFGHYPLIAHDANGSLVPVVTTAGSYKYLGALQIEWDSGGNVVSWSGGPIRVSGVGPDAVAPDAAMQAAVVDPVSEYLTEIDATIVATSEVGLDAIRDHIRSVETNEGNLIADAYLWQASEKAAEFGVGIPDVALTNGGGIRNDNILPAGDISILDTFSMVPFGNFVTIVEDVSRSDFKDLLENAVSRINAEGAREGGGTGRFAQIAGFTFEYDSSLAVGSRVTKVTVPGIGDIVLAGAVQPGPSLIVATNGFSAGGGDEWFGGPPGATNRVSVGVTDQQALQGYLEGPLGGNISAAAYPIDAGPVGSCAGDRIVNTAPGCVDQFGP